MYHNDMETQNYTLTNYGKYTNAEALAMYDELQPGGEAREYIDLLAQRVVSDNPGIREFGRAAARELIIMAIVKGFFTPLRREKVKEYQKMWDEYKNQEKRMK